MSDVLEFLGSKLNQTKHQQVNSMSREFTAVRNVVNGFLKRTRDKKVVR